MARMQGHESVLVEIDGPPEDVQERLMAVEGVNAVSRRNGHGGRTSWEIDTGKDAAIRSEVARTVVESGWGLYEIRSVGMSLEDVFLQLTGSEPDVTEVPPDAGVAAVAEEATEASADEPVAAADEPPPSDENEEPSKQEGAGTS